MKIGPFVLSLYVLALSCSIVSGCGSTGKKKIVGVRSASSEIPPSERTITGDDDEDDYSGAYYGDGDNDDHGRRKDRDNDSDNNTNSYFDSDDLSVRHFGHAANSSDRRDVSMLIKRYYAVGVAYDGAAGCSMIMRDIARSIPEDLGRPPGPRYLRGSTCAAVLSKVFRENHRQLVAYAAALRTTSVRVAGSRAIAVLGFRGLPGRQFHLRREGDVWEIEGLLNSELP